MAHPAWWTHGPACEAICSLSGDDLTHQGVDAAHRFPDIKGHSASEANTGVFAGGHGKNQPQVATKPPPCAVPNLGLPPQWLPLPGTDGKAWHGLPSTESQVSRGVMTGGQRVRTEPEDHSTQRPLATCAHLPLTASSSPPFSCGCRPELPHMCWS